MWAVLRARLALRQCDSVKSVKRLQRGPAEPRRALGYGKKSTVLLCMARLPEKRGLAFYATHSQRDRHTGTSSKDGNQKEEGVKVPEVIILWLD